MNKTLSIGLAGFSFMIEEHAYIKLSDYLSALRNSLDASEVDEVMHDIEIRIVEIFNESLGKRQVVLDGDVELMISKIGAPEVIEKQEQEYYSDNNTSGQYKDSEKTAARDRQLFRDPERQKIAGVCAGLAYYSGMDLKAMRIIWVLVFLIMIPAAGSAVLILILYAILWLVVPKAQTASDFLKMKGKPVNFGNLKDESNKIVQFANESTQRFGEIYEENKPLISKTSNGLWNIIRYILGGIFGIFGIGCLIGSAAIFGASYSGNAMFDLGGNMDYFLGDSNLKFITMAFAFMSTLIPAIIFLLLSIKLLSPKTKLNYTGYVIGGLIFIWIALLAAIGFSAAQYENKYSGTNEDTEKIAIASESDSLFIEVKKIFIPAQFKSFWNDSYSDGKIVYKKDYPDVEITRKAVAAPYLIIKKTADGYNLPINMKVPVEVVGNKILLPNYMIYPYQYRQRDYDVDYELVVPQNMKVIRTDKGEDFYLSEEDEDINNLNPDSDSISVGNGIISITTRETASGSATDRDSMIINGKKYSKDQAKEVLKNNIVNGKSIDIDINDGKNGVSIKTK